MKLYNFYGWIAAISFFLALGAFLNLAISVWYSERIMVILFLVFIASGFLFWWLLKEKDTEIKWREKRESQNAREDETE